MKQRHIDIELPDFESGLVGLVRAVARLMDADDDELLAISSAAFCNYVFDPEVNQHEEERREFSVLASLFSNYGPWESISYFTGWEVLEVNALDAVETLKLVVFELEHDRPIVTLTPELQPTVITGHQISVEERRVHTPLGDFAVDDDSKIQADHDLFENWLLLVRPGERAEWAASPTRQKIDVLRWAAEHADAPKEFFQETSENYAPGLRAIARFQAFLDGLSDPAGVAYAEQYVRSLHAARAAAASSLRRWASPIASELQSERVESKLLEAAKHYGSVASALANGANFVDAAAEAANEEHAAVDALRSAVRDFPAAFEG